MAKQTKKSSSIPTGVKVISVLYYISAALALIGGLALLFGSSAMSNIEVPGLALIGAEMFIGLGIFAIAMAVLDFFIARGLWKAQKWARILVIILSALAVLGSLIQLVQGEVSNIIGLIVAAIIGGYLLFSKKVKAAFA